MQLIIILCCFFAERLMGSLESFRDLGWVGRYQVWARARITALGVNDPRLQLLLLLLPPLLLLQLVFLGTLWLGWPIAMLFSLLVVLYCMGPRDLDGEFEALLKARKQQDEPLFRGHVADLLGELPEGDEDSLSRRLMSEMFVGFLERQAGVVLWFLLLGPVGALLYRMTCLMRRHCEDEQGREALQHLHHILTWLPARTAGFGFALAGSFVGAIHAWRCEPLDWSRPSREFIEAVGLGALAYQEEDEVQDSLSSELHATLELIQRSRYVWLAVLAVLTLLGWIR